MTRPDPVALQGSLRAFIAEHDIKPDPQFFHWHSGVYAVLDCVFSSQAVYETTVLPALKRFAVNSGLEDQPGLTFTAFVQDVDRFPEPHRFATYARDVMGNSQQLSGQTKVQVAYNVCQRFISRGYNTKAALLAALPQGKPADPATETPATHSALEEMVLGEMIKDRSHKIRGMGAALGPYLLMSLGVEDYVKPDTLLLRLLGRVGGWQPRAGHPGDLALIQDTVTHVAKEMQTSPARLDNALWRYESTLLRGKAGR
ncbi:hypothetical protein [Deinococcus puniceus]|uniref:Uncharacterized protein n=1 Tax=Deinococcus puniceus TaxID=1182568 RepID=A0A172T6Q8_9DEIO|nr:hypothetical protein [Deinococcus puniceus]ANE42670.1 hypothetical protein SU48_01640 [Deinococcus puniceus]